MNKYIFSGLFAIKFKFGNSIADSECEIEEADRTSVVRIFNLKLDLGMLVVEML